MVGSEDLLICTACGTQFDTPADEPLRACRICDVPKSPSRSLSPRSLVLIIPQDPRQYVPPSGQSWTSLAQMRGHYKNVWVQDEVEPRMWSIATEPKFGIGQRCIMLQTPGGNVLWDCIAYLDDETVKAVRSKGGLKAIVISHPHYYTTHLDWAEVFDCPVYIAVEDEEWFSRVDRTDKRRLIQGTHEDVVKEVVAAKPGGHFPGSLVLSWEKMLFIADTLVTVPSAFYHIDRPPGTTSYAFMWSIPNMIPLPPSEMYKMWQVLKILDFESTHGAFTGVDIRDKNLKQRVLESMRIQTRNEGYEEHSILEQRWPE